MKILAPAIAFAIASTAMAAASPPISNMPLARTQVITFNASMVRKPRRVEGYCWTSSIASERSDAYRCMVGNEIRDPCFVSGPSTVLCPQLHDPRTGIRIALNKPLPAARGEGRRTPWLMHLEGSSICSRATGTVIPGYPFDCTNGNVCSAPVIEGRNAPVFVECGQPKTAVEVSSHGRYLATIIYV